MIFVGAPPHLTALFGKVKIALPPLKLLKAFVGIANIFSW